jgi:hypothetical protein
MQRRHHGGGVEPEASDERGVVRSDQIGAVDRGRAKGVGGGEDDDLSGLSRAGRELRGRRRLSGSVAHEEDHVGLGSWSRGRSFGVSGTRSRRGHAPHQTRFSDPCGSLLANGLHELPAVDGPTSARIRASSSASRARGSGELRLDGFAHTRISSVWVMNRASGGENIVGFVSAIGVGRSSGELGHELLPDLRRRARAWAAGRLSLSTTSK